MAYAKSLAERIRHLVSRRRGITEKKMFGSVCFLLNGNILVGVWKDSLIARVDKEACVAESTCQRIRHHWQANDGLGDG